MHSTQYQKRQKLGRQTQEDRSYPCNKLYFQWKIPTQCFSKKKGIGAGLCYVPVIAMCALYFDKRRSLAVGLGTSGIGVGAFALPPLVTVLEEEYSWRGLLLILSAVMFNMCVLALLMRPLASTAGLESKQNGDEIEQNLMNGTVSRTAETGVDGHDDDVEGDGEGNENVVEELTSQRSEMGEAKYDDIVFGQAQGLSHLTYEMYPSPDLNYTAASKTSSPTGGQLRMASELLKRNKYLTVEPERSRAQSFNQVASMSSETINKMSDQRYFCSVQELFTRQHSNLDVSRKQFPSSERKSLTNLSIMLMGSVYNIVAVESKVNSMLSLASKASVIEEASDPKHIHDNSEILELPKSTKSQSPVCFARLCEVLKVYGGFMRNRKCLLTLLSNSLVNLTYLTPVIYLVDRAVEHGIDRNSAVLAISLYGAGNICGRVLTGIIADLPHVNRMVLYFICIFLCGLITCLSVFCGSHLALHAAYGFLFGVFIGGYVILTPVVLVDILGVEMVSQSYGLCLLFMGVSTLIGTPMGGWMFDITGRYGTAFVLYGCFMILSSLLLMPAVVQSFRRDTHDIKSNRQDEAVPLDSSP